ncbi:response regulator [Saccharospirillum impatiens]|uniref:response regulator n=1 Tax=Saccharospirillum impatiens TaxID=169438 RepID=UPI0003FE8A0B|nr:response regulator [Saccharospirillum impatiens]
MNILIVEDDPLMRELLLTIVGSIRNGLSMFEADDSGSAWSLWCSTPMDLVLCDWNLQGIDSGLDLARRIRKQNGKVPIVMVTGRGDRHSVIASHRAGLNGYIVKPFTPDDVMARLTPFFPSVTPQAESLGVAREPTDWIGWLNEQANNLDHLTLLPEAQKVLTLQWQEELPTAKSLARLWQDDVIITSRLLSVANGSEMRRHGRTVSTLLESIATMGVSMAIAQVSALLLNQNSGSRTPAVRNAMKRYAEESQRVAEAAAKLAARLRLDPAPYYTAGLLYRLGEFAVLDVMEQHPNPTSPPDETMLDRCVPLFASQYGNAVKLSWQLPLQMREFIGAAYYLPPDTVRRDLLLMHLAGELALPDARPEKVLRLQRVLGLDASG